MNDDAPSHPLREDPAPSNRFVIVFGAIMLVGLLCLAWIGRTPTSTAIGQPLPHLDLQPLLNAPAVSNQDLQGKVVVMHFWGTWCPQCALEFPEFVRLVNQFQDDPEVVVLSVSCSGGPEYDLAELKQETATFLSEYGSPDMPTYCDAAAMTRQQLALMLPNGSLGYPTTIVADQQGIITDVLADHIPGEMQKLVSRIKSLL